ncbi:addiction module protein [bacterium]|nr:addiction module protein [bacterium]
MSINNISVESMSIAEKLEAINLIWSSLAQEPDSIPSPDWHAEELAARTKRLADGTTSVSDWEDAEKRFDELGQ